MENCDLKGFIATVMSGDSINLRHDRFKICNCQYTIEIYRPGDDSPPVIARYNLSEFHGLGLTDFLRKPLLTEELLPKLQSAIFSFVNTSALFGSRLRKYRENQETVFQLTTNELTEVVREMNKLTVEKNHGAIEMADYEVHWDDGRITSDNNETGPGESLKLTQMVLTGLDTLYSEHAGGPFRMTTVRIGEKLQFSSLQVRGKLEIKSTWSDTFDFAAEIRDLILDLHIILQNSETNWVESRQLEVEGMRRMSFTVPSLIFGSAESMIDGYLLKEVPKLINSHSMDMFDQAIEQRMKANLPDPTSPPNSCETKPQIDDLMVTVSDSDSNDEKEKLLVEFNESQSSDSDHRFVEENQGIRERDTLKKTKKRFKSPKRPRRRGLSIGKRVAHNEIRNK